MKSCFVYLILKPSHSWPMCVPIFLSQHYQHNEAEYTQVKMDVVY